MPELPEVETICVELKKNLVGRIIKTAINYRADLRIAFPQNFSLELNDKYIIDVKRRSKYILIELDNFFLVIHLGMSGRLTYHDIKRAALVKHDHAIFNIESGELVYNDPRRFGLITFIEKDKIESHKLFKNLGPEPLTYEFDYKYLHNKFLNKNIPIKTALMDNFIVVGVGNIYASESLFRSGILPIRPASSLSLNELKNLTASIKETLQDAINAGGSSLRDYVNSSGEAGYFQNKHNVYNQVNCKTCKNQIIKIKQSGRASFYCSICQK